MFSPGLLVVHDTGRGGEDDVAELTRRQQLDDPLLEITDADVVAGGDDTGLVQAAVKLDDNLAGTVVVDLLEFTNVAWIEIHSMSVKQSNGFSFLTAFERKYRNKHVTRR